MNPENIIQALIEILGHTASLLIGLVLGAMIQPIRTLLQLRGLSRRIKKKQRTVVPSPFIAPSVTRETPAESAEISDRVALLREFREVVSSRKNGLLLAGSFGVGKTFLAKYLVSLGERRPGGILPIYLDASRFKSENVLREVRSQFEILYGLDLSIREVSLLLRSRRTLLVLDGLDQIPSADTRSLVLSGLLTYVENAHLAERRAATVVLVLRTEFLRTDERTKELRRVHELPVLMVRGLLSAEQRARFFKEHARIHGDEQVEGRIAKVDYLCSLREDLFDLLSRPLLLSRMRAIEVERISDLEPSGVPLARAFRLSFEKVSPVARELCRELAWWLYCEDKPLAPVSLGFVTEASSGESEALSALVEAGILVLEGGEVSFAHLTFRDYFAAEKIVAFIAGEEVVRALDGRIIHYLVSEFVAGLLGASDLEILLAALGRGLEEGFTQRNGFDILTEVKGGAQLDLASAFVEKCLDDHDFESAPFDAFIMFIATTGAVYGRLDAARYVIRQLHEQGLADFQGAWFYTSRAYAYYGGSLDICINEWLEQLRTGKHSYFRMITSEYLGAIGYRPALPVLEEVAADEEEDPDVRETARKVAGVLRDVA